MDNKLESNVFQSMFDVGCKGVLLNKIEFVDALEEGTKSVKYTQLVNILTDELRVLNNIDESVNVISAPEDSVTFLMELSSFLKELGCPYVNLTQGHISDRLTSMKDKLTLLEYLLGELMSARIVQGNKPEKKLELKLQESSQASDLRKILQTLGFSKPPTNITIQTLFQKLIPSVQNAIQKADDDLICNPIFNGMLSEKQWVTLGGVQKDLHDDYIIRREMLLKRLDCTIQSFQWSDKTKGKDQLINNIYSEKRKVLNVDPDIHLSDLLTARDDLAIIEKTSNAAVRRNTQSSINKVIIGQVPDRGGRTSEQVPPPPEMPSWQQRTVTPSGGGRGGYQGGGGFGRGGGQQYTNYTRGGGQQTSSYSSREQQNTSYAKGGSQQTTNYTKSGSFDSAGSYGNKRCYISGGNVYSQEENKYNNYGRDYSKRGGPGSFDSAGSYGTDSFSKLGGNGHSRNSDSKEASAYSQGESSNVYGSNPYNQSAKSHFQNETSDDNSCNSRGGNAYSKEGFNFQSTSDYSHGNNYLKGGKQNFNSSGNYEGYSQFQQNKTTYADQYVQESQRNQQYRPRDNKSGRGQSQSNYKRGGF